MLEEFRRIYIQCCGEQKHEPQDSIIRAFKHVVTKSSGVLLNLSTLSLSFASCVALGKALEGDDVIGELYLNDCMLSDECAEHLLRGLTKHLKCTKLEMKGNQLRGTAARAFCHLLRYNKRLTNVVLEWNSLGMLDDAFGDLCDGLAENTSVKVLDLRNNQISMDGAKHISSALKRNRSLRELDLRWNNCGLIGAKSILDALSSNKIINRLEIAGNNSPSDIIKSIEAAIGSNCDNSSLKRQSEERTRLLTKQLAFTEKEKQQKVSSALTLLEKQEEASRLADIASRDRIIALQDALHERHSHFEALASKLTIAESENILSSSKVEELQALLEASREERSAIVSANQHQLKTERDKSLKAIAKLEKELTEVTEKLLSSEGQTEHLRRQLEHERNNVCELKEQLAKTKADLKLAIGTSEEKITAERAKARQQLREENDRAKREADERVQRVERERMDLEEELRRARATAASEKTAMEQMIADVRTRERSSQEARVSVAEEKARASLASKDEIQSQLSQANNELSESRLEISRLERAKQQMQRKIDELERISVEVQAERSEQNTLKERVTTLERQLKETNSKRMIDNESHSAEVDRINHKLRLREEELDRMRMEHSQKASLLQSALTTFIAPSSTGHGTSTAAL
ncbi:unnamed protein product [Dimorphilus gyrociliatus]|uniref:Uncharacterized protein n=1 Tax=Dimorphilus gyrociliatus TaxID=2664684 RepID=A0A7I8VRG2_9ANNE|nr:unnamed protein product [Dimorphilus gyrociliatus]